MAAHLERQRQSANVKKAEAIPAASLTNLATQRLSLQSEHGQASVTPQDAAPYQDRQRLAGKKVVRAQDLVNLAQRVVSDEERIS
eukprot:COSAG02_NODE_3665_length_6391_cov_9.381406_4_plen_85_part_00